jgi:transcriptional regulator with XRE-family HTH domain
MTFGARLSASRRAKGLTQEGLGKGLGTDGADASKSVVYGWEKDQHYPRVDQLVLICEKLGCGADYLLFGKVEAQLSPEVGELAQRADALPHEPKSRLLMMWQHALTFANESLKQAAQGQQDDSDQNHPVTELGQRRRNSP